MVFVDWYLPGFRAGGPIRSVANMLEHLGQHYHFTVITRNTDYLQQEPYDQVTSDTLQPVTGGHAVYLSEKNINAATIKKYINDSAYDTVYINGMYSWYFSILPAWYAKKAKKTAIISPRGMLADSAVKIKSRKKQLFLYMANLLGLYKNSKLTFHTTTQHETDAIRNKIGPHARIVCAENFPQQISVASKVPKESLQLKLFCIARVAPEKNIAFALQCLQELPLKYKISYKIYGEIYDQQYAENCQKLTTSLRSNIKVDFCGSIKPTEISKVFEENHVFFLPTRGENYGHAIIEALLAGIPVLISDQTPWRNLAQQGFGADISLDQKNEFVKAILHFAALDEVEYNWMRENIRLNAAKLVHLPELEESYHELFHQE